MSLILDGTYRSGFIIGQVVRRTGYVLSLFIVSSNIVVTNLNLLGKPHMLSILTPTIPTPLRYLYRGYLPLLSVARYKMYEGARR
jgi:hypothetical protein